MRKTPILKLISAAFAIGSAVVAAVLFALLGQTEAVAESSFVSTDTTTRRPTLTTMFPPTTVSPTTGVPFARTLRPGDNGPEVLALQQRLQGLGYWLGVPDGACRARTVQAVLAFQKVAGIERSGTVELETHFALGRAIRPEAASTGGDLIEVDKARQVLFVVHRGSVEWILNVSTGTDNEVPGQWPHRDGRHPAGNWQVAWDHDGVRVAELGALYRPRYFHQDGIAVHGYRDVPDQPSSHGCVRVSNAAMDWIWAEDLMPIGSPVWVY